MQGEISSCIQSLRVELEQGDRKCYVRQYSPGALFCDDVFGWENREKWEGSDKAVLQFFSSCAICESAFLSLASVWQEGAVCKIMCACVCMCMCIGNLSGMKACSVSVYLYMFLCLCTQSPTHLDKQSLGAVLSNSASIRASGVQKNNSHSEAG